LPAHCIARLLGRDSLQLRRPKRDSYWLSKALTSNVQTYFSPGSIREGNGVTAETPALMGGWVAILFMWLAGVFAPRKSDAAAAAAAPVRSAGAREQGIPDEIYTLW
jgi:hypothetical protein